MYILSRSALSILIIGFLISITHAQLKPSSIFSNGMVVQRNIGIPVWGVSNANTKVIAELNGVKDSTIATQSGAWEIKLPALEAGGPFQLILRSGTQKLTYTDVYVGDVWFASGQSNMAMQLKDCATGSAEISSANNQKIRQFSVANLLGDNPVNDIPSGSTWIPAVTANVGSFSATGYYFAKFLYADLNIPIGIIHSSVVWKPD